MAYRFNPNQSAADGAAAILHLKTVLESAGWTCKGYGSTNGNVYRNPSQAGAVYATVDHAFLYGVNRAWFVMQQPAGGAAPYSGSRQLLFVAGDNEHTWYIAYSRTGAFTGGAAETPATAPDQVAAHGSHSGSHPAYSLVPATLFDPASFGPHRVQCGAFKLDDEDPSKSPFSFYFLVYRSGQAGTDNIIAAAILFEGFKKGTYSFDEASPTDITKSDLDPHVLVVAGREFWFQTVTGKATVGQLQGRSWYKLGTAGANWNLCGAGAKSFAGGGSAPNHANYDHVTSKIILLPIEWGSTQGYRGIGATFKWPSVNLLSGQFVSLAADGDHICFDDLVLPWPGEATAPLL